jgi:hypothetical protein
MPSAFTDRLCLTRGVTFINCSKSLDVTSHFCFSLIFLYYVELQRKKTAMTTIAKERQKQK